MTRRKACSIRSGLSAKLADCQKRIRPCASSTIVRGDSAGGSASRAASGKFQAILPLKGKILNVEEGAV